MQYLTKLGTLFNELSMQPCYLICGVSGSGKSWVCRQLVTKFHYIPHDEHYRDHVQVVHRAAVTEDKPIITECPFGERILRSQLEAFGVEIRPYFVIEHPAIIARRYYEREKKILPKAAETRASTILSRASEWRAPWGTSAEILQMLQRL
jgi:cytidylate kinase